MNRPQYLTLCITFPIVMAVAAGLGAGPCQAQSRAAWVYADEGGKLVYKTTAAGDRIMDFSHAGYMGGGVALPTVPAMKTVQPSGADDTASIQAAVDAVAAMPLRDGFRGAVILGPGNYVCSGTIKISAGGIVLRGSGADKGMTTIKLVGKPHNAIGAVSSGSKKDGTSEAAQNQPFADAKTTIAEAYVPSGSYTFSVADAKGFAVGDTIAIRKAVTADWVKFMHMDDLVRDGEKQTWLTVGRILTTERRIKAIAGNKITLEVPLSDSFDAQYFKPAGFAVVKIKPLRGFPRSASSISASSRPSRPFRTRSLIFRRFGSTVRTAGCATWYARRRWTALPSKDGASRWSEWRSIARHCIRAPPGRENSARTVPKH